MSASRAESSHRTHRVRALAARSAILAAVLLPAGVPVYAQQNETALSSYERASLSRAKGKDTAPLFVYEFADFECPHCARFALDVFPRIDSAYVKTGKVHWVFVNLPLPTHRNAWLAHEAAVCSGAVADKFWAMHDRLFATQDEWGPLEDPTLFLKRLGRDAGVPAEPLAACMAADRASQVLLQDVIFAASARVSGTPAFIVNNEQSVMGLKSFAEWKDLLDRMLAAKTGKDAG